MGLLDSIVDVWNRKDTNAFNKNAMQNRHQWEVQDLIKAGLNPILSAGGTPSVIGGASAPPSRSEDTIDKWLQYKTVNSAVDLNEQKARTEEQLQYMYAQQGALAATNKAFALETFADNALLAKTNAAQAAALMPLAIEQAKANIRGISSAAGLKELEIESGRYDLPLKKIWSDAYKSDWGKFMPYIDRMFDVWHGHRLGK